METTAKAKKWGDSIGIVLPKRMVTAANIKPNDILRIEVFKEADISDLFGSMKRKVSGQKFKNMAREGWK